MSRRMVTIIIGVIVMLLIAAGLAFVLQSRKNPEPANANQSTKTNLNVAAAPVNQNTNIKRELTQEEKDRNDVTRIATIFTERYGTFTDRLNTEALNSLKDFVASSYFTQLTNQASSAQGTGLAITTKVLSTSIDTLRVGTGAVATVTTLRNQSSTKDNSTSAVNQTLTLRFLKEDNAYKIISAQWGQPKTVEKL